MLRTTFRLRCLLTLIALTSSISVAADGVTLTTLPIMNDPQAKAAESKFSVAEEKAKAEYDKAVASAKMELIKKLEERQDAVTKAGKLDDAVAIRSLLALLKPKTTVPATQPALPEKPTFIASTELVGTWQEGNGTTFLFRADGHFIYAGNQPGKWQITETSLLLNWNSGRIDTYNARDGKNLSGTSSIGHNVNIRKN